MKNFKKYSIIGAVVIGLCFYLFFDLASCFLISGAAFDFDEKITNLMVNFWSPKFVKFFSLITYLGSVKIIVILLSAASFFLLIKRKFIYLAVLLLAVGGGEISLFLAKNIFQRERPWLNGLISYGDGFSFPSGHAMLSIIFYGICFYLMVKSFKKPLVKSIFCFSAVILILLIGFSRIYLGVHWFSDVLAGYVVGFAWLLLAILFLKFFEKDN